MTKPCTSMNKCYSIIVQYLHLSTLIYFKYKFIQLYFNTSVPICEVKYHKIAANNKSKT